MRQNLSFVVALLTSLSASVPGSAATFVIKGASLDAPSTCETAEGALVCKVDGQQFELWIARKPLAPRLLPADTMARKMAYFTEIHDIAVKSIFQSTANDKSTPFSSYGSYAAMGAAMPGSGAVSSPAVRFASVLHEEDIWEFLEIVAKRTPAIDALSAALQRTLKLPAAALAPVVAAVASPAASQAPPEPAKPVASVVAPYPTFSSALISLQYPDFLEPVVMENTATAVKVNFVDKSRPRGPNLMITLRAPNDTRNAEKLEAAAVVIKARKDALMATMAGKSASVDVNALGEIKGFGFALLGVPDVKKGLSGIESFETTFAADTAHGLLEVRLGAEQKFNIDTQTVWALLAKSIRLGKT